MVAPANDSPAPPLLHCNRPAEHSVFLARSSRGSGPTTTYLFIHGLGGAIVLGHHIVAGVDRATSERAWQA